MRRSVSIHVTTPLQISALTSTVVLILSMRGPNAGSLNLRSYIQEPARRLYKRSCGGLVVIPRLVLSAVLPLRLNSLSFLTVDEKFALSDTGGFAITPER